MILKWLVFKPTTLQWILAIECCCRQPSKGKNSTAAFFVSPTAITGYGGYRKKMNFVLSDESDHFLFPWQRADSMISAKAHAPLGCKRSVTGSYDQLEADTWDQFVWFFQEKRELSKPIVRQWFSSAFPSFIPLKRKLRNEIGCKKDACGGFCATRTNNLLRKKKCNPVFQGIVNCICKVIWMIMGDVLLTFECP